MIARRLMDFTRIHRPDLYDAILFQIQPHRLDSVLKLIEKHFQKLPDLNIFNENIEAIPEFMWSLVKYFIFPCPGDAFGIKMGCRVTKSDTQCILDSKHLQSSSDSKSQFNVERNVLHDLDLFSNQKQVFEQSNKHMYSAVYVNVPVEDLMKLLPRACHLTRNGPRNKGENAEGEFKYLSTFEYIIVRDGGSIKVFYKKLRELYVMMRRTSPKKFVAFSDVRGVFDKCGIVCYFFNMVKLVERQMFHNDGSVHEKDVLTLVKYQCRSGKPLSLTRDGLAKNPERTPMEVLSFEAPKRNFARYSTCSTRGQWFKVESSADKIFFGQQFNEGTGYSFALISPSVECNEPMDYE